MPDWVDPYRDSTEVSPNVMNDINVRDQRMLQSQMLMTNRVKYCLQGLGSTFPGNPHSDTRNEWSSTYAQFRIGPTESG